MNYNQFNLTEVTDNAVANIKTVERQVASNASLDAVLRNKDLLNIIASYVLASGITYENFEELIFFSKPLGDYCEFLAEDARDLFEIRCNYVGNVYTVSRVLQCEPHTLLKAWWFTQARKSQREILEQYGVYYSVKDLSIFTVTDHTNRHWYVEPYVYTAPGVLDIVEQLIDEWAPEVVVPGFLKLLNYRRLLVVSLKAALFNYSIKFPSVDAFDPSNQIALLSQVLRVLQVIYEFGLCIMIVVNKFLNTVFNFMSRTPEIVALCELLLIVSVVKFICALWTRFWAAPCANKVLSKLRTSDFETARWIGTREEYGRMYAEILLSDGAVFSVEKDIVRSNIVVKEMAMAGSEFENSCKQNVGAILLASGDSELRQVGVFWRLAGDVFITADHVANVIRNSCEQAYLAGIILEKSYYKLDVHNAVKIENTFFDLEENLYPRIEDDVFARRLESKFWSRVKVPLVPLGRSQYKQNVTTLGFIDGTMKMANGTTVGGSGPVELTYTASTRPGFSGAPVFAGRSVVAMHLGGSIDSNRGIRIERIVYLLNSIAEGYYPDHFEISSDGFDVKYKGRSCRVHEDDDIRILEDDYGNAVYLDVDDFDSYNPNWNKRLEKHNKNMVSYGDECNNEEATNGLLEVVSREKPIHVQSTTTDNPILSKFLESKSEELTKLGYEPEKFSWPEMSKEAERVSFMKHVNEIYAPRVASINNPPTQAEVKRVVNKTVRQLSPASYLVNKDYKTIENFMEIIDSTAVQDRKSPGFPYQETGLMTNGQVIERMGKRGLAETVLREWSEPLLCRVFMKNEPTKKHKIDAKMTRIIAGFPLHKMIKHQAIARNFAMSIVDNWTETPAKFPFSPSSPGHCEHLFAIFKGRKVVESDKKNWDYSFYPYFYDIIKQIMIDLAVKPNDMTDDEFEEYKNDVAGMVDEVCNSPLMRTSDGTVYRCKEGGIMKSGWFLTIVFNTIAQIVLNNLVLMRMGVEDDDETNPLIAGGDDVLQSFNDDILCRLDEYKEIALNLGVKLEDFVVHDNFNGCEFFSHKFRIENGIIKFLPVNFSKAIYNIRAMKLQDLPLALSSHMSNYCFDKRKYDFFREMYLSFREDHPHEFLLKHVKSMNYLRQKAKGAECVEC